MAAALYRSVLKLFILIFVIARGVSCAVFNNDMVSSKSAEHDKYIYVALKPGQEVNGTGDNFEVFCQEGAPKSILYIWRSAYVRFLKVPSDYKLYNGENATSVYLQYHSETVWHPATWVSWRGTSIHFPAFGSYCLGVKTQEKYTLELVVRTLNYWKIIQLLLGIAMFYKAKKLSRSPVFHYSSGISLGILASILVLLYVATRFIQRRLVTYAFLVISYSVVLYYIQQFYSSLHDIVSNYASFLLAYIVITAVISFVVCYRFGPVKDKRTFNIIQWGIQSLSLLLIFYSTEYREVSTALILVIIISCIIPTKWIATVKFFWYKRFPSKMQLLTESEYIEQGTVETRKALEELREYCNSPECKTWSTIKKLKNPQRFAEFVEGDSHLTDEEILTYDLESVQELNASELYDEESEELDDENMTVSQNHISSSNSLRS